MLWGDQSQVIKLSVQCFAHWATLLSLLSSFSHYFACSVRPLWCLSVPLGAFVLAVPTVWTLLRAHGAVSYTPLSSWWRLERVAVEKQKSYLSSLGVAGRCLDRCGGKPLVIQAHWHGGRKRHTVCHEAKAQQTRAAAKGFLGLLPSNLLGLI